MRSAFSLLTVIIWGVLGAVLGVIKGRGVKKPAASAQPKETKPSQPTERRRASETVKLEYPDRGLFGDLRDE